MERKTSRKAAIEQILRQENRPLGVEEILNLQPRGRHAKLYQVKQVRGVIVKHRLAGEDDGAVRG